MCTLDFRVIARVSPLFTYLRVKFESKNEWCVHLAFESLRECARWYSICESNLRQNVNDKYAWCSSQNRLHPLFYTYVYRSLVHAWRDSLGHSAIRESVSACTTWSRMLCYKSTSAACCLRCAYVYGPTCTCTRDTRVHTRPPPRFFGRSESGCFWSVSFFCRAAGVGFFFRSIGVVSSVEIRAAVGQKLVLGLY